MSAKIGRYTLTEFLGEGSFGCVYGGVNEKGEEIAMKFAKGEIGKLLLKNEIKVLLRLKGQPGINRVKDWGKYNGENYIVTERLDYALDEVEYMSDKEISMRKKELDKILKRIRKKGVMYKDVKLSNLMIKNDKLYVIDYGIYVIQE